MGHAQFMWKMLIVYDNKERLIEQQTGSLYDRIDKHTCMAFARTMVRTGYRYSQLMAFL